MINKLLRKIIRIGRVTTIYPERATVRVQFDDLSGIQSAELQVLMRRTHKDKDYDMFAIGEQVLCLFLPIARNTGFVIGSIYTVADVTSKFADNRMKVFKFEDGTEISYDRENKLFKLHSEGDINITTKTNITMTADGDINLNAKNITLTATEKFNIACDVFDLNAITSAKITTKTLTIDADTTTMSGTLGVGGEITADGDVSSDSFTLNTHAHPFINAHGGNVKTSPPG